MQGFVDTHSHMVPSGDDGVRSVSEGVGLVLEAGRRGTVIQYATPHAMRRLPVTGARRREVAMARGAMRRRLAGRVDFRVGWEVSPQEWFLDADPAEYRMEGLEACLIELPLPHTRPSGLELFVRCAEHIEAAGLVPIMGHPERCGLILEDESALRALRERDWIVQVNASSLMGRHGRGCHDTGWRLVESGECDLIGSDGHRAERPPHLDSAFAAVSKRIGHDRALPLFTGAALAAETMGSDPAPA